MRGGRRDLFAGAALLACAIFLPFAFDDRYAITQTTLFFLWATVVTQWNLVLGVGGVFSLAQMALFAFGAMARRCSAITAAGRCGWRCQPPLSER